ncbi:MAG: hypothetical protein AAGH41_13995 [Pseudomonadota bacterium]
MIGRSLIVGIIWMASGITLVSLAEASDRPEPFYVALGLVFVLLATYGNFYALYGFGKSEDERRPGGKIPLLRKLLFFVTGGMLILLAMQLTLSVVGELRGLSLTAGDAEARRAALTTLPLAASCGLLLIAGVLVFRWSKHAILFSLSGAASLIAADVARFGFAPRSLWAIAYEPISYGFLGIALIPFILLLVLGRLGGDLR